MVMFTTIAEAKAQLSACIARAEAGERVVITRHGRPVAVLHGLQADAGGGLRAATGTQAYLADGEPAAADTVAWQPVWGAVPGLGVRVAAAEETAPVFAEGVPWHPQDPV